MSRDYLDHLPQLRNCKNIKVTLVVHTIYMGHDSQNGTVSRVAPMLKLPEINPNKREMDCIILAYCPSMNGDYLDHLPQFRSWRLVNAAAPIYVVCSVPGLNSLDGSLFSM